MPSKRSAAPSSRASAPARPAHGQVDPAGAEVRRRFPIGAEVQPAGGVHFRVWAPKSRSAAVELERATGAPERVPLTAESSGYFSGLAPTARAGMRYRIHLDAGAFPDPASRFQPDGPHGASEIVDPDAFRWTDHGWRGRSSRGLVIYELHLGTFTPEGTWRAAAEQLSALRQLGITTLEVMPIAEFAGAFGWGYDGVDLFAPTRLYGTPDDARAFVNRAHELGLMVILDVVYNHLGPDGNYLTQFAADYLSRTRPTEWGESINFDGPNSGPVREFFLTNARTWIQEFHFDGLRLDATQQIFDRSTPHFLTELAAAARTAGGGRITYLVAENEPQHAWLVRPVESGGCGMDAIWNDDFHHTARVAATGHAEAYYSDYQGTAREFVGALKRGFLFQGQWCRRQQKCRGSPALDLAPEQFVVFLQNHDQVANSLRGERLHQLASPGVTRALTAVLLLGPQTPLLFQGQEFGASAPFLYFADHSPELRRRVSEGRRQFLGQFPTIASSECHSLLAEPAERETFLRAKLDWAERERHAASYRLHADLLRLRREDATLAAPDDFDAAVLDRDAFVYRCFSARGADRLLIVNLGRELRFTTAEPLLAPTEGHGWDVLWSSEAPLYDGNGTPPLESGDGWTIPGCTAVLLQPGAPRDFSISASDAHD
ncbi:malto-oligosyltrehalose trehalohydrolase [Opitutus terrae]|uniref:Malto-oligosyltrehalose trehalohydrolase n=1 Tax=Opitutus terrae (strain DSM 11246 / JCM 15787 / PB90-1) TaxID=452637 RepID=B1ZXE6_OPITP|nr:malto-oligosyltrehalose trehalohydrolase [Opitutus terrae]ACB76941.1 malto-oligosyltrehalose trehalohydrolase [Opitutus terrae PB90-1]